MLERLITSLEKIFGRYPFSVIFTNVFAALFAVVLVCLALRVDLNPLHQIFNLLLILIGALAGWAFGMFFAPYDEKEKERFSSIGRAVSAFVSGYALSKVDRFLEATMFVNRAPVTIAWVRVGLVLSSSLLVMLTVFSNRAYFRPESATSPAKVRRSVA